MIKITPVVKNLLIINILMFFGTIMWQPNPTGTTLWDWGRLSLAMFYPASDFFNPFQIITHMFMHADAMHLIFNMFGLYMFGSALESNLGKNKFLKFYLIAGFGALAFHLLAMWIQINFLHANDINIHIPMLGASGALYGVMVGFGMKYPNAKMGLLFLPIMVKAKYFIPAILAFDLYSGLTGSSIFGHGNIAHFAHLGGALTGFILSLFIKKDDQFTRWN